MKNSDLKFELFTAALISGLFLFNFWLFYPGYVTHDWASVLTDFNLNNHHPFIYSAFLNVLCEIFGYHIWYPLLFNLIPFYLGIFLCIIGFYKKYHSKWAFLLLFPLSIGNYTWANIMGHCSYSSPMIIFLLWSILLYQLLTKVTKVNMSLAALVYILALLSRHNAIIQAFPVCFVYGYIFLPKDIKSRFLKYLGFIIVSAIASIPVVCIPKMLPQSTAEPGTHIFLHQLAGMCVPANDTSCFEENWYLDGKGFNDVVQDYIRHPIFADTMSLSWNTNRIFRTNNLTGLYEKWAKAIFTYPHNYQNHIERFIIASWKTRDNPSVALLLHSPSRCTYKKDCQLMELMYPKDELYYRSSLLKSQIYSLLYDLSPHFKTKHFVSFCFILFIITGYLFIRNKNKILLFSASSAFAGWVAFIIFSIFSPAVIYRYMHPILTCDVISLIGIGIYIFDQITMAKKNKK